VSVHASAEERQCLVIGVCTRRRNALLRRLLESLACQAQPEGYDVMVFIIDNNDVPSATEALQDLPSHFPISVVHEPRAGLVFARNRALDEAVNADADWFIGVDDDEWVADDWLAQLIDGMQALKRPILLGPVVFEYDDTLSPYLEPFQIKIKERGRRPSAFQSGNMALHRQVFDPAYGPGLRFDPALNQSGGEDVEYFRRAERQWGWVPASWPDAVAFESWSGDRATLRYRIHYAWRICAIIYRVEWLHCRLGLRSKRSMFLLRALGNLWSNLVYGVIGLLIGSVQLPFWPETARLMVGRALLRGARAVGILSFFVGIPVRSYADR